MKKKTILALAIAAAVAMTICAIGYIAVTKITQAAEQRRQAASAEEHKPVTFVTEPEKVQADEMALTTAVHNNSADAKSLARLGNIKLVGGAFDKAIDLYKKALAIDPAPADTWSALGEAYVQTIQSATTTLPPPAHEAFANALTRNPLDVRARFYLAMEKDFTGHHDEAVLDLIRLLRTVPQGSFPDEAIRAALRASVTHHAEQVKQAMADASTVQPKGNPKPNG